MSEDSAIDEAAIEAKIIDVGLLSVLADSDYWYGSPSFKTAISIAAKLHNSGKINVLDQLWTVADDVKLKRVEHAFWQLLATLNVSGQEYLGTCDRLLAQGVLSQDSFTPPTPFAQWLEGDSTRWVDVLAVAGADLNREIFNLHLVFKKAASESPRVAFDAIDKSYSSSSERRRCVALRSLIEMTFVAEVDQCEIFEFLSAVIRDGEDADKAIALDVFAHICLRNLSSLRSKLDEALQLGKQQLSAEAWAQTLVDLLWRQHDHFDEHLLIYTFEELRPYDLKALGCLDRIGFALYGLMETDHWRHGVNFVNDLLLAAPSVSIKSFQTLSHAMIASAHLAEIVCDWFANGRFALCHAAVELLSGRGAQDGALLVAGEITERLTAADRLRLGRRAVGYCLHMPVLAASLVVAAMRGAARPEVIELQGLLVNPLMACYRGKLRAYLEEVVNSEPTLKEPIEAALTAQDNFFAGLESSKHFAELAPSQTQRVVAADVRSETEDDLMATARDTSPFSSLVSHSRILFGDTTVSYFPKEPDGDELRRNTLEMKSYGYEYEIPRLDCWDPIGLQMHVYILKSEPADR